MRKILTPDGLFLYDRETGIADIDPETRCEKWTVPIYAQMAITKSCNLSRYCTWCLPGNTRLSTPEGFKEIQDISPGDTVLDGDGISTPVVRVFKRDSQKLLEIKPVGLPPLYITPEHEIFIRRPTNPKNWKSNRKEYLKIPAEAIKRSDLLIVPLRQRTTHLKTIDLAKSNHVSPIIQGTKNRGLAGIRKGGKNLFLRFTDAAVWFDYAKTKTKRQIEINGDFFTLLGIYCGDGHTSFAKNRPNSGSTVFTFGRAEKTLVNKTKRLIRELFGVTAYVSNPPSHPTTTIVAVSNSVLTRLLSSLCGSNSYEKKAPEFLHGASNLEKLSFINGLTMTDGSYDAKSKRYRIVTVSVDLAYLVIDILHSLGIPPYAQQRRMPPSTLKSSGRTIRSTRSAFCIAYKPTSGPTQPHYQRFMNKRKKEWYYKICYIREHTVSAPVFDIEVAHKNHSFVAEFLKVSNCYATPILNGDHMPFTTFTSIVDVLDRWGTLGLATGGGEPFTHPQLIEMMKYIHDRTYLSASITTNGILGTDEKLHALEGNVGEIRMSIYDEFSFRALPRFLGRKFDFGVNVLFTHGGLQILTDKLARCYDLGVRDFLINSFVAAGWGSSQSELCPTTADYSELVRTMKCFPDAQFKISGAGIDQMNRLAVLLPFSDRKSGRILAITADNRVKLSSLNDEEGIGFESPSEIPNIYQRLLAAQTEPSPVSH